MPFNSKYTERAKTISSVSSEVLEPFNGSRLDRVKSILGGVNSFLNGSARAPFHSEDWNQAVATNQRLVETDFQHSNQFKISFSEQSPDFDLFAVTCSYTPIEATFDTWYIGHSPVNFPDTAEHIVVTVTFREHEDKRVQKWLTGMHEKVFLPNGLLANPFQNQMEMTIQPLDHYGEASADPDRLNCLIQQVGEIEYSYEEEGMLLLPCTFIQTISL